MAFNTGNSGDFLDFFKYNAKAGRFYFKDVEVKDPVFVADLGNIKTGWFFFKEGQAPEKVYDPSLSEPALRPDKKYTDKDGKERFCFIRGAEFNIFSNQLFGGVVNFGTTSLIVLNVLSDLHTKYEDGLKSNAGLLPVVSCKSVTEEKGKYGTNYKPNFVIEKWVPRPAEFDGDEPQAVQSQAPAPQAVAASVSEF